MRHPSRVLVLLVPFAAACGADEYCDAGELTRALAEAEAGDTVEMGACVLTGSFTVPGGVELIGQGTSYSAIVAAPGEPALILLPGLTTRVRELLVSSDSPIAVLARGAGQVAIENFVVQSSRGIGLGAEDLSLLELTSVSIEGPVNPSNVEGITPPITATTAPTWGLVLIGVDQALLNEVDVAGYALGGAAFDESGVTWSNGQVEDNRAHGILQRGGASTLNNLAVRRTLRTFQVRPSFAAAFLGGADVTTADVIIENNHDRGVIHQGGTAVHENLIVRDNTFVGVWAENMTQFELAGDIQRNAFAGLIAVDVQNVSVHDATIDDTALVPTVLEAVGLVNVGDGIQLVRSQQGLAIDDVTLSGNERSGITIELDGGALGTGALNGVTITVTSTGAHGAIAQSGTVAVGWDSGIMRVGVAGGFDTQALLTTVEGVGPCETPPPDATAGGLLGLTGL